MKKSELKSGMMVCFGDSEERHLVLINMKGDDSICDMKPMLCGYGGFRHFNYFELSNFNEDLTTTCKVVGDINKVYDHYGQLVWERKNNTVIKNELLVKANELIIKANELKEQASKL